MSVTIFSGMKILSGKEWLSDLSVVVENGIIADIAPSKAIENFHTAQRLTFASNSYLIPGMIDLHIHGAKGCDVMDTSIAAINTISEALLQEGVTGFLATTMTAETLQIESVLQLLGDLSHPSLLGIHLEGPFISAKKLGAQVEVAKLPPRNIISHWQKLAKNKIKLMTLAPELPHSQELITHCVQHKIICSVGHSNATYAQTQLAIEQGCSYATHLFNAIRPLHQREPGAIAALLLAADVWAELIVDDIHLHPAIVDMAYRVKGLEKLLLVSDAMRAKCMPDGDYGLGGQKVQVKNKVAQLADGTIAGSTLCLIDAVKNFMRHTQCNLAEALLLVTLHPAIILGIANRKGSIAKNLDADLVVLDDDLQVQLTMQDGAVVWKI